MSREKNYTKGPWSVLGSGNEDLFIEKHKILTVTSVETSDANFQIEVMDASDDTQKAEANASLISAAPELLEALEGFCDACRRTANFCSGEECDTYRAIKKAYGETE